MSGRDAALAAGYPDTARVRKGVTATIARRDPWVQAEILKGRARFEQAVFASLYHLLVTLGVERPKPGMEKLGDIPLVEAVKRGLSSEVLRAAGWLKDGRLELVGRDGEAVVVKIERVIVDGSAHAQD
jgi:hypothetical protein